MKSFRCWRCGKEYGLDGSQVERLYNSLKGKQSQLMCDECGVELGKEFMKAYESEHKQGKPQPEAEEEKLPADSPIEAQLKEMNSHLKAIKTDLHVIGAIIVIVFALAMIGSCVVD